MQRSLREIQEIIARELTSTEPLSTVARELFCESSGELEDQINLRFNAYRRNFLGSRLKALADTYHRTKTLVGEKYFLQMARQFALLTESSSADLGNYGTEFPDFIRSAVLSREEAFGVPYLADIAALERAVYRAARGRDGVGSGLLFGQCSTAVVAPTATSLLLINPYLALVRSPFALLQIWEWSQESLGEIKLIPESHDVAVWKRGDEVCVDRVSMEEIWIIEGITRGLLVEELIEKAPTEVSPEICIPELIQKGLIIGYR